MTELALRVGDKLHFCEEPTLYAIVLAFAENVVTCRLNYKSTIANARYSKLVSYPTVDHSPLSGPIRVIDHDKCIKVTKKSIKMMPPVGPGGVYGMTAADRSILFYLMKVNPDTVEPKYKDADVI